MLFVVDAPKGLERDRGRAAAIYHVIKSQVLLYLFALYIIEGETKYRAKEYIYIFPWYIKAPFLLWSFVYTYIHPTGYIYIYISATEPGGRRTNTLDVIVLCIAHILHGCGLMLAPLRLYGSVAIYTQPQSGQ